LKDLGLVVLLAQLILERPSKNRLEYDSLGTRPATPSPCGRTGEDVAVDA
jgi:hypothetical protein